MLTDRILPQEEWHRLDGDLAKMVPVLDPTRVTILVVEEDGVIVAHVVWYRVDHLDGLWIAPEHRGKTAVARRGLRLIHRTLYASGARTMMVSALDQETHNLFAKRGVPFPGQTFVLRV